MNLSGFRGTPLTRLIIFALLVTSLLVSLTSTKHYFHLQLRPHLLHYHQFSRIFLWQTIYANSGELLFSCAVLYSLRVVERMFGTRKFASFLAVSWVGTSLLGVIVLGTVNAFVGWWSTRWGGGRVGMDDGDVDAEGFGDWIGGGGAGGKVGGGWNYLPPGPTAVVFAALAQYHAAVPSIYNVRFLPSSPSPPGAAAAGATVSSTQSSTSPSASASSAEDSSSSASSSSGITLTDKLPVYILASQLAFSQPPGSLLAAAVGWVFGYAYRAEIVPGSRWRVPGWLFDRSGGEYENLRRRLAAGEFAEPEERGDGAVEGVATGTAAGGAAGVTGAQQRRPLMGQILDQFRGAF